MDQFEFKSVQGYKFSNNEIQNLQNLGFALQSEQLDEFDKKTSQSIFFRNQQYFEILDEKQSQEEFNLTPFFSIQSNRSFKDLSVAGLKIQSRDCKTPKAPKNMNPNTVNTVVGCYWIVKSLEEVDHFLRLTDKDLIDGKITLDDGFTIWIDEEGEKNELIRAYAKRKKFALKFMVLRADDPKKFAEFQGVYKEVNFFRKKAFVIPTNPYMFDLLVI